MIFRKQVSDVRDQISERRLHRRGKSFETPIGNPSPSLPSLTREGSGVGFDT
jgi:hypothetical protein